MRNFFNRIFEKHILLKVLAALLVFTALNEGLYRLRVAIGFSFGTSNFGALAKEVYGKVIILQIVLYATAGLVVMRRRKVKNNKKNVPADITESAA